MYIYRYRGVADRQFLTEREARWACFIDLCRSHWTYKPLLVVGRKFVPRFRIVVNFKKGIRYLVMVTDEPAGSVLRRSASALAKSERTSTAIVWPDFSSTDFTGYTSNPLYGGVRFVWHQEGDEPPAEPIEQGLHYQLFAQTPINILQDRFVSASKWDVKRDSTIQI